MDEDKGCERVVVVCLNFQKFAIKKFRVVRV